MAPADLGNEAILLLRRSLGVGSGWISDGIVRWSYWGVLQSAWSEPVQDSRGAPAWRIRLATRLLDGFSRSAPKVAALDAILPHGPLGAYVVRRRTLELVTAVDLDEGNHGSMVQVLAIAARAHAADARRMLSDTRLLARTGLISVIDAAAPLPETFVTPGLLRESPGEGSAWSRRELALCLDGLRSHGAARAVETPWGVSASFPLEWTSAAGSVIEARPDVARDPFKGGLAVTLWTPVRGGTLHALDWNGRDTGPGSTGNALGGWWAEGGYLVHRSYCPAAVCQPDLVLELLQTYIRRAHAANACVAAIE